MRQDKPAQEKPARPFFGDPLYRLLAVNLGIGAIAATLVVAGILLTDTHNMGSLVMNSSQPLVPVALLYGGFLITFCSAAMGWAIMRIGTRETPPDRGGGKGARVAVPVLAESSRRGAGTRP